MINPLWVIRALPGSMRRARPKSTMIGSMVPSASRIMMLEGFKSRWMTFLAWAILSAAGELGDDQRDKSLGNVFLLRHVAFEAASLDKFHREIIRSVDLTHVVNLTKIRVTQCGGGTRFLLEAFQDFVPVLG